MRKSRAKERDGWSGGSMLCRRGGQHHMPRQQMGGIAEREGGKGRGRRGGSKWERRGEIILAPSKRKSHSQGRARGGEARGEEVSALELFGERPSVWTPTPKSSASFTVCLWVHSSYPRK